MKGIKAKFEAFDALSLRERLLILSTVVVAVVLPLFLYVVEPAQKELGLLNTKVMKMKAEQAQAHLELQTLLHTKPVDPNDALHDQLAKLQASIASVDQQLAVLSASLVEPQAMVPLLEKTLSASPGVRVVGLMKAAPQPFSSQAEEGEPVTLGGVYRHDVTLEIEGSYAAVVNYLKTLESLSGAFFWDGIDYQVSTYPLARVVLNIHTLSSDAGWLGV